MQNKPVAHTPRPDKLIIEQDGNDFIILLTPELEDDDNYEVARTNCKEDAEFLIKCGNAHDPIVAALKRLGSVEGFEACGVIPDTLWGKELKVRIEYARQALTNTGEEV